MITIFFERDGSVCESVHFATEGCYVTCYSALEHYARLNNLDMTEVSTNEDWHEDAEDVLRDYENKEESNDDDRMISTVSWINEQIEIDNLKHVKK